VKKGVQGIRAGDLPQGEKHVFHSWGVPVIHTVVHSCGVPVIHTVVQYHRVSREKEWPRRSGLVTSLKVRNSFHSCGVPVIHAVIQYHCVPCAPFLACLYFQVQLVLSK